MNAKFLEELRATFDFPIYLVTRDTIRDASVQVMVDKLTLTGSRINRKRYFVVPGVQCSCLGWMKFNGCKHLKMVAGDFSWNEPGVPSAYAAQAAEQLVEQVGRRYFPHSVDGWRADEQSMPELVTGFEFAVVGVETPKGLMRLVSLKQFPDGLKLAVSLVFSQEKAKNPEKTGT